MTSFVLFKIPLVSDNPLWFFSQS